MERQTRQEYIHDLEVVQDLVATMGDKALDNVEKSMKALLEGDTALAKSVMKADDVIDDMIVDVEDKCILLICAGDGQGFAHLLSKMNHDISQ